MFNETPITIAGNLTADPDLRFTPSGKAVCNLRVAANPRRWNAETGKWEDGTPNYFDVEVWGPPAENVAESAHQGERVLVLATVRTDTYTPKGADTEVRRFKMVAQEVGVSLQFATATPMKVKRTSQEEPSF
jgi:single-strand DNA-binding protein